MANVTATFCPPSGKNPGFYQQPLSRKAPSAGGDEDTAAAPGKRRISWRIILLCRHFYWSENHSCFIQVDPLDSHKAADVLLKIASLYNEDSETKTAVFEIVGKCKYLVISFLNR